MLRLPLCFDTTINKRMRGGVNLKGQYYNTLIYLSTTQFWCVHICSDTKAFSAWTWRKAASLLRNYFTKLPIYHMPAIHKRITLYYSVSCDMPFCILPQIHTHLHNLVFFRWPPQSCCAHILRQARMKTDGMNPVSSATVYRFFPTVFVFSGINGNGTENGTE